MITPDRALLEDFIQGESRLLDDERWDEWNSLFTEDGVYWMPAMQGQVDARQMVSLMHDSALLRDVRIRRYRDPNAFSLQPRPRAIRLISGIRLDRHDPVSGELEASARLVAAEHRAGETTRFHAAIGYRLVPQGPSFRIRLKRVDLIDCDAPRGDIHFYL